MKVVVYLSHLFEGLCKIHMESNRIRNQCCNYYAGWMVCTFSIIAEYVKDPGTGEIIVGMTAIDN